MNTLRKRERKQPERKWFALNIVTVGVLLAVILCIGAYGGAKTTAAREVFARNLSVDGVPIGGLTYEEGRAELLKKQEERLAAISVPLQYKDQAKAFSAAELGVTGNAEEVLQRAYSYNKQNGSFWDNYTRTFDKIQLQTDLQIDQAVLRQSIDAYLDERETKPQNATAVFNREALAIEYTEGRPGMIADREAVYAQMEERVLSGDGGPVVVWEAEVQPEFSSQEAKENTALIGECRTDITDSDDGRLHNIDLLCDKLNGTVLLAGETLSLGAVAGERAEENGYLSAPVISDGLPGVSEVGGGVCQVAGTLYNAALRANMGIVERVRHSWPADYLDVGLDAALIGEDRNLVLSNESSYPIYIGARREGGIVEVKIFGQPSGYDIQIENSVLREVEPQGPRTVESDEYPAGSTQVTQAERTGYEVEVYRNYLKNDIVVDWEKISYDFFPEARQITTVGTG